MVRATQKLAKGSGFAVVGSWTARIGEGEPERLGLLMNGRFVRAQHLTAADSSEFSGYEVAEDKPLPVAFVVKRGVRRYKMDGDGYTKDDLLDYHATVALSGRFRTVEGVKFWLTGDKIAESATRTSPSSPGAPSFRTSCATTNVGSTSA